MSHSEKNLPLKGQLKPGFLRELFTDPEAQETWNIIAAAPGESGAATPAQRVLSTFCSATQPGVTALPEVQGAGFGHLQSLRRRREPCAVPEATMPAAQSLPTPQSRTRRFYKSFSLCSLSVSHKRWNAYTTLCAVFLFLDTFDVFSH